MANAKIQLLPDLNPEKYYEYQILSNSGLGKFWRFMTGAYDFTKKVKPETLRFGQILHSLVYEPFTIDPRDVLKEIGLKAANQCFRMAEAARNSPTVAAFLKHRNIIFEKPVYFLIDDVPFSIRPDALIPALHGHDLKSTATTTLAAFRKSCVEYGYFRQMYLYKLGTGVKNYYITGISKAEPHKVFTVDIREHKEEMKEAKSEAHELIRLHKERYPLYHRDAKRLFGIVDEDEKLWFYHADSDCYFVSTWREQAGAEDLDEIGPAQTTNEKEAIALHKSLNSNKPSLILL